MPDPFEESLKDMLKSGAEAPTDYDRLDRVLKTANRQVGAGDLFGLMGRWGSAVLMAINNGSGHVKPVRGSSRSSRSSNKQAE
ncbi:MULTISPECIES: hypothetical protein [Pseudomonas]|jgi:hypothetical protein|uniref:CrfX protein n=2 Tax=Pseudomonas TaxID=286 RepID=A0A2X2ESJ0_PSELU|nr:MULTISPECIES: hypothetical protein [Pseudomonas]AYN95064.1 CrfX protein [Pseudomonas sp. LTJR-52]ENA30727.1 hypothetical protein HMPREF1487_07627 [Pseudomonas sp. HPB0071]MBA1250822.1 CrfX protein [Pseudomonas zeshuii]MBW5415418.1 CrfX protein [Pseudomonas sp. MAG002Y]MCG7371167.1 CrfX protein [Pseudomonas luteola]